MILIILSLAAYMVVGVFYFSFTCEDEKVVANPAYWLYNMIFWGVIMWK